MIDPADSEVNLPKRFYRNRLPYFQPHDSEYFVTYRLAGSIPKHEVRRLMEEYKKLKRSEDKETFFREYDRILDLNGPYHLQKAEIRSVVRDSLAFIDEHEMFLWAYCIMPNHVHLVGKIKNLEHSLFSIMQRHKSHTGRLANRILGATGQRFWQKESHDQVVREYRLGHYIEYTIMNPVMVGFVKKLAGLAGNVSFAGVSRILDRRAILTDPRRQHLMHYSNPL